MKKINIIYLLVSLLLSSCVVSLTLKAIGANAESAKIKYITSNSKKVAFIEMHHIGIKPFYDDVYSITDSLGRKGFVTYFEGVKGKKADSITVKKVRKITGIYLGKEGYLDTVTHTLFGKFKVNKKYINQPKNDVLISKNSASFNVDTPISKLVLAFENVYGEVVLDSCDLKTVLGEPYKCKSYRVTNEDKYKAFDKEYVLNYRNNVLAKKINDSEDNNIIVIYGKAHFKGLVKELKKLNPNWKI